MASIRIITFLLAVFTTLNGIAGTKKTLALRITNTATQLLDETTVYLDYGTSSIYNWQEDSKKVFNSQPLVPQIYSLTSDNEECFINGFGPFITTTTIELGVKTDSAGTFSIGASIIDNFDATSILRLKDKVTGLYHDLRQGNYIFSTTGPLNTASRFALHVSLPTQISTTAAGCSDNDGILQISQDTSVQWSQCLLYDDGNTLVGSYTNITGNFNFTGLGEGNYFIAFVYGVYVATVPVSIEGNAISLNAVYFPNQPGVNETIQFYTFGRNINNYSWDMGDGTIITGIANPEYAYSEAGTYTITITASNNFGCVATDTVTISVKEIVSGLNEPIEEINYTLTNRQLTISNTDNSLFTANLLDLNGRNVFSEQDIYSFSKNLSYLPAGLFVLQIEQGNKRTSHKLLLH